MAPEQATGAAVDARVDLYALGLVMFAMLTGRPPFRGGDVTEVLRRQRKEQPPRVSAIVPGVPEAVDDLVARLLSKDPADRPPSALAVGRSLAALDHATGTEPQSESGLVIGSTAAQLRSAEPTLPIAAGTGGTGVDLLAATQATAGGARGTLGSPEPGATQAVTSPTGRDGKSLAHRATQPNRGLEPAAVPPANRFTTVEELDRVAKAEADRVARRDRWIRVAAAGGLVAAVLAGGYAILRPLSADQLYDRIRGIADAPAGDLRDAEPLIEQFVQRFPTDPRADSIRTLAHELELDALERRVRRRPRSDAVLSPIERDYRSAAARESESPLACLAALEAILTLHGTDQPAAGSDLQLWLDLVRRQIARVGPLAARERTEDLARAAATLAEARTLAAEAASAPEAQRPELLARRRELLSGLVEMYGTRPHAADAVAEARILLEEPD